MDRIFKILFFALVIKPIVLIVLGLNIRHRAKLPMHGPAILAANHNSHLDTMVLMSLYPLTHIHKIRPVAAADYFFSTPLKAWFSTHCLGIIPLDRSGSANQEDLFRPCHQALDNNDILIIFPEGSRGAPEQMSRLRKGLFYMIKDRADVQVTPVVMHGLGKALPKGTALFVPFNCDVVVGDMIPTTTESIELTQHLKESFEQLLDECLTRRKE